MTQVSLPTRSPKPWLLWLVIACLAAFVLFFPAPVFSAPTQDRIFRVEATSNQFTPALLQVNPGDRVTIQLVSTDVAHGLYVDGYGLDVQADPGQPGKLSFTADRPGIFRLRCSIPCGAMHPFIVGQLSVGPNWALYRAFALAGLVAILGLTLFTR